MVGFGADLWRRLQPDDAPAELGPFEAIEGDGRGAPATQHDLWVWTHGTGEDVELDVARAVVAVLAPVATLAAEQPCFVYLDSRDLTGLHRRHREPAGGGGVRGRARARRANRVRAARSSWPRSGCTTSSKFHAQSLEEQEGTIGRTKPDSVELDDKPPTAHIARVVIEEDGEELELYRRSTPYGRVGELGLYFLAFSADPSRFTKMLHRMFGVSGDGLHDHLTDFTPAGQRRVLLRAVARRPRRHPARPTDEGRLRGEATSNLLRSALPVYFT